ncbi:helix-turn-helix domain-containing protein [Streptoalloteichus hindustanus]|uniref:Helix-turn-helix domain-containing protein n=1 Tax=Streptoalloteichus hindustanus TaxID=2017 RepID=A0A1M5L6V1_STRHI|nr:helix-turn-helix transcriptional regulator [Streptoalloteichus hindustanus]SHG60834.1 Helix-turn-helix domain-containing protein [Streptoalloteichus hindustanus]
MTPRGNSAVHRRYVAYRLKKLREEAGYTQRDVAKHLDCVESRVGHYETMHSLPRWPVVETMLRLYQREDLVEQFRDLLAQAKKPNPWADAKSLVQDFELFVGLEQGASTIETFTVSTVPGLLQTRAYATEVLKSSVPKLVDGDLFREIELRMARQEFLAEAEPPRLWSILDESALRRMVGGPAVMANQLGHLLKMAEEPHVEIQVLPPSAGAHPALHGPFTILGFAELSAPRVAYVENQVAGRCYDDPEVIRWYTEIMNQLRTLAAPPEGSREIIKRLREEVASP